MAIPAPLAEFFFHEHRHRAIEGNLLTLGRQTILFDEKRLQKMLATFSHAPVPSPIKIDEITVQAKQEPAKRFIDDSAFFSAFNANLQRLDITDYEGAEILHDMCKPLPADLHGKFDFIFNGSILDNLFDPASAMRNISLLLKPTGRVLHIEMASRFAFEYLMYSPDWFMDYYVANGFKEVRAYIAGFNSRDELLYGPWDIYEYFLGKDGAAYNLNDIDSQYAIVIVIAEKQAGSTHDVSPVQWCYRDTGEQMNYKQQRAQSEMRRPIYGFGKVAERRIAGDEAGLLYCGKAGSK